ncbi:MAG: hypothetical protein KGH60_02120 [Candidatus Micrarchaeota archaeon]|nr:hypothetical protein [Candidatus Micrarchaeota archaeon]
MPIRVYECDRNEADALKKFLKYDPYDDPKVLPSSSMPKDEKEFKKLPKEEQDRLSAEEAARQEKLKKLREDRLMNIIFWKQEYEVKDGASVGLNRDKVYIYLNAPEDFLAGAEEKLKNEFKSIKRATEEEQEKVAKAISSEKETAATGFGSIFGG